MENKVRSLKLSEKEKTFIKTHEGKFTIEELAVHLKAFPSTIKRYCKDEKINLLYVKISNVDGEELFNLNEYKGDDLFI
jgi:hypothetical protein